MADWSKPVYSSNVSEIGYREADKAMLVTWQKGRRSVYWNVPEELALQVANAPSVGSMLNTEIKPYYRHSYE